METRKNMPDHTIDLPITIEVDDYHEFSYLEKFFKLLNSNIKIKEVNTDSDTGKYTGIVYINNLENLCNTITLREWGC